LRYIFGVSENPKWNATAESHPAQRTRKDGVAEGARGIFHSSMIELGLLGVLVLVLVVSIPLLRRYARCSKDLPQL
jgi:hypothetical protein